jgi:hypothetical protein
MVVIPEQSVMAAHILNEVNGDRRESKMPVTRDELARWGKLETRLIKGKSKQVVRLTKSGAKRSLARGFYRMPAEHYFCAGE